MNTLLKSINIMKAIKILAVSAAAAAMMVSCAPKQGETVDPTTVANVKDLLPTASQIDSVSYLIGVNFGYFIKANDFAEKLGDLNMAQLRKGMSDFINAEGEPRDTAFNKQFKVSPELMNEVFNSFLSKKREYKSELNRREGVAFLEKNKTKEGVVETESGLQYEIIEAGNDVHPALKDTIMVNYTGTLLDGTEFDSSNGTPVKMFLTNLIKGWQEGIPYIGEGGQIKLYVPADLGYGTYGSRSIEPNSTLIFEIELTEVHPFVDPEKKEE